MQGAYPDDFMAELGPLALGSRLRRLADRLYRDASAALEADGRAIAPNHVPVLACLARFGEQRVTDLTRRLGVSQPGVTRMVMALSALGLVGVEKAAGDQRQSLVRLTSEGERQVAEMQAGNWPKVAVAAGALFKDASGDLMQQLAHVEAALDERSLAARIAEDRPA